jgi:Zn-dependent protease/CBS domain-containing protein
VRVDFRWFIVLIMMSWLTATGISKSAVEDISIRLIFGFVTTLIFFFSIFLHELAHCLIARMENVEVIEIVLHPFGGLARFKRAPQTARAEFRIAIAGPAASFVISIFFLILMFISNFAGNDILSSLLFLLVFWNMLLAIFNLFPGYPLDGGRVLRAFLWKRGRDLNEATILTGRAGQIIAVTLIVVGLFIAFGRRDFFTGLWTVIVGAFLFDSANGIIKQTNDAEKTLVTEVMSLPFSISPKDNVLHFVDNILPLHRQTTFLVAENKRFYGVLKLEDLKELDRNSWHKTNIQDVMRPVITDYIVEANSLLTDARELMRENEIGAVGVINDKGELVGFLQRNRIRRKN